MDKREKALAGLKACSIGVTCGPGCPYEKMQVLGENGCIATMARNALELIEDLESGRILSDPTKQPAQLMPRELLLHTWGHGWEESHFRGDDEDPEGFELVEVVWINGHIMTEEGRTADADSDYWQEHYGKRYGIRIWTGDEKPTREQREGATWAE